MKVLMEFILIFFATLADYMLIALLIIFVLVAIIPVAIIHSIRLYKNKTDKTITKEVIERIITEWIVLNKKSIKSFNIIQNKDNSSAITIEPKSQQAATIVFDIRWQMALLTITVGDYIIGFDNGDEDFHEIDERILRLLLYAYENGNYYIKDSYLNNGLMESNLYFILNEKTEITGIRYGMKLVRRWIAKHKISKFKSIDYYPLSTEIFLGWEARVLDKIIINKNFLDDALVDTLIENLQADEKNNFNKLYDQRDYSFNDINLFIYFLERIHDLSDLQKSYLLGMATLNSNGYIREKALYELEKLAKIALPFIFLRLRDWVPEVRRTASRVFKSILWKCHITDILNGGILADLLNSNFNYLSHMRSYFLNTYLKRQTNDDLLQLMSLINDKTQQNILWKAISQRTVDDVRLFNLAQKCESNTVRHVSLAYIPFDFINEEIIQKLKKLPTIYIVILLRRIRNMNVSDFKLSDAMINLLYHYFYNTGSWEARVATRDILTRIDGINPLQLYRDAINANVSPSVIRGLGEVGTSDDVDKIIPFIVSAKANYRIAALYALFSLKYPDANRYAEKFLKDKNSSVRRETSRLLQIY